MEEPVISQDSTAAALDLKAEIRRGTVTSLGAKIEEMLEKAEKKAAELGGAKKAMQAHVKNLLGIVAAVDEEIEKSIPNTETAKLVKSWLLKTVAATENLAAHLGNVEMQALGEINGYQAVHDHLQKIIKEINNEKMNRLKAIEDGKVVLENGELQAVNPKARPTGVRPAPSIAQQRKAKEAQSKETKKGKG